jgi:hypothetical protein
MVRGEFLQLTNMSILMKEFLERTMSSSPEGPVDILSRAESTLVYRSENLDPS